MTKKFAIIAGEPNSINSEIIAKSWKKIDKNKKKNIFIIGNYSLIDKQLKKIKIKIPITKINKIPNKNSSTKLMIYDIPLDFINPFNVGKKQTSKYILESLNCAHLFAVRKEIKGFVNCAIDKKRVFNKNNIGITDYLAKKNKLKTPATMLIYNNHFSVSPVTTHIKVNTISRNLSKKLIIKQIVALNNFFFNRLGRKPTIAILGLNPHNAELINKSEERKIIIPSIKKLKKKKLKIIGPYPADTIFSQKNKYKYDVIVGMYHDQVLAPFKALFGYDAINITLGLNYIRVSPDHGVAKDLIKKNKANPLSLIKAINFLS